MGKRSACAAGGDGEGRRAIVREREKRGVFKARATVSYGLKKRQPARDKDLGCRRKDSKGVEEKEAEPKKEKKKNLTTKTVQGLKNIPQ